MPVLAVAVRAPNVSEGVFGCSRVGSVFESNS